MITSAAGKWLGFNKLLELVKDSKLNTEQDPFQTQNCEHGPPHSSLCTYCSLFGSLNSGNLIY